MTVTDVNGNKFEITPQELHRLVAAAGRCLGEIPDHRYAANPEKPRKTLRYRPRDGRKVYEHCGARLISPGRDHLPVFLFLPRLSVFITKQFAVSNPSTRQRV